MKIENQVTSLETSKKLKELGIKQESLFYWLKTYDSTEAPILNHSFARTLDMRGDLYSIDMPETPYRFSAFTASELAEMLPPHFATFRDAGGFYRTFGAVKDHNQHWDGGTLVEALAACLIYLKENKLI